MSAWRDLYAGDVRPDHVGQELTVAGWVARRRDHGGLIFIDLRDHTGIVQLVVNPERAPEAARIAHDIRSEFVVRAQGEVVRRAPDAVNPNIPTGGVELQVNELEIVSRSEPLPFQIDDEGVEEPHPPSLPLPRPAPRPHAAQPAPLRNGHRCDPAFDGGAGLHRRVDSLDDARHAGGRPRLSHPDAPTTRALLCARPIAAALQAALHGRRARPLLPDRDCWRDEDLRADRQFEFRQLDLELAFPTREEVLDVLEQVVVASFEALGRTPPSRPFPRMSYADAMLRYGSDKPDLRFGLEIQDATALTRDSQFGVFANAETVRYLVAPKSFSRGELQKLEDFAKEWGAKGLAYLVYDESGEVRSPIAKFLTEGELEAFRAPPGSTVLFVADSTPMVERVLGALRLHLGQELGLVDESRDEFHWVLDFPLFLKDEDTGQWTFVHHPFTSPLPGMTT